jgi:hypothetical protein
MAQLMEANFDDLPDLPIENICEQLANEGNMVQTNHRIHKLCQKYIYPLLEKEVQSISDKLNLLGPLYHSWFGLRSEVGHFVDGNFHLLQQAIKDGVAWIDGESKTNITEADFDQRHEITYDLDYLNRVAQTTIPFNKVIIKSNSEWYSIPEGKWYNQKKHNGFKPVESLIYHY